MIDPFFTHKRVDGKATSAGTATNQGSLERKEFLPFSSAPQHGSLLHPHAAPNVVSSDIPEYYRHLMNTGDASNAPVERPSRPEKADDGSVGAESPASDTDAAGDQQSDVYHADTFQFPLPGDAWTCETTYTILGPVSRGMRHNITVTQDRDTECATLQDYTAAQMEPLESSLPQCTVLMHGPFPLISGDDAYRCIYRWQPEDGDRPLYQEQVYVFAEGVGYTLTASFRRDTRKQFGPMIERMMRSFRVRLPREHSKRPGS